MSAAPKGLRQKMTTVSCCSAIRLVLCLLRLISFTPLATGGVRTPRDEAFGYIVTELFFRQVAARPYGRWHNWGGEAT
ncbi:MAG: hypothetical protein KEFWMYNX_000799 [Candidatus Fervidibacter sp.]|jgi:hypothetical protein